MMLIRLGVIGFVAILTFFAFVAFSDKGAALNNIMPALGGADSDSSFGDGTTCMPPSVGNIYFNIPTPVSFCSCLKSGKDDEQEIIASGSTLDEYKMMCIDVSYKQSVLQACSGINAVLVKNNKKTSVDCGCLFNSLKGALSYVASFDGKYKGGADLLTARFDKVTGNDNNHGADSYYELPRSVVERCTKK